MGVTLEERATLLGAAQRPLHRPPATAPPLFDIRPLSTSIARAVEAFRTSRLQDAGSRKAAEWFLDNHYLVARTLRQITSDVPSGFRRRLPYVAGDSLPRIFRVARDLVEATSLDFDERTLYSYVAAYQTQSSLTIAELWALPAMLRLATLQPLAGRLDSLFDSQPANSTEWERLEPNLVVQRAIRVLRVLSEMDWKQFVQQASAVEAALGDDPSGVYARMDFEARDGYRKVVESLAWDSGVPEPEVARAAVALAAEGLAGSMADDPRLGHVGYYLIDAGQRRLKDRIGYRARGLDRARGALLARPTLGYLGSVAGLSLVQLSLAALLGGLARLPGSVGLACVLLVVPVSSVAVAFTNWWVSRLIAPRPLPKLDFSQVIPVECRTAVAIPALVANRYDIDRLLAQLELHYLSSPDPSLAFVLLTDHVDAPELPDDADILAHAERIVRELNAKYASTSPAPFHVLHRESRWNSGERSFMGWERKRGKLEEFNRLLRGDVATSYKHHFGDPAGLEGVRFVLTLDADTQLPIGAARRLIGLAAHPLNSARFDAQTGRVMSGYTVAQPRVEASPVDGAVSLFSRIWCGDTALDIYTHAASDVYQDLFGSGAYVGKGIYEVDAFQRSVEGRVPANALASHDLFEGIHGRAALATDIAVFEQYPQNYLSFARRTHRWIRGDWQLFPWLLARVPSSNRTHLSNRLSMIDRWKILDNLRRSLLAPSILALFVFECGLSGVAPPWTLAPLLIPLFVLLPAVWGGDRRRTLGRWALGVAFLPHEAWIACDAIARAVVRMAITRRHLLQWVTSADSARTFAPGSRSLFWREMGPTVALTACGAAALGYWRPGVFPVAAPVLALWLAAPEIARWISIPAKGEPPLSASDRRTLRHLARRTWLFFETFVGPGDQWLAPDNFQEEPGAVVAHRTSPTNIGLMLVAELSAYDLGYIGRAELSALVHQALETLDRLERYRGHWLNWYNTRTLEPLSPRYVSTVDSGNLAAALVTMAKGCRDAAGAPTVRPVRFVGLGDTLDLLEESLERLTVPHSTASHSMAAIRRTLARAHQSAAERGPAADTLTTSEVPALEMALLDVLEQATVPPDVATFREVRTWFDRFRHQLRSLHGDIDARQSPEALGGELLALADRIDVMRAAIDFTFLFDPARKLLFIGYNATSDRLDAHHYDLLASEARLASFLAVVQSHVPPEHWFTLGRPVTRIRGEAALLSWGGTMFEYLMPNVFMRSQERTLLQQSVELAVVAQIEYGKKTGKPWGVSESGFVQLDAQRNYQYRSFGVPVLGLRRGLEEDRVVAPYACVLALRFGTRAVLGNLVKLTRMGAAGLYGLFEAVDYDDARAAEASRITGDPLRDYAVVRSYMAHHQGMILAALNNALNEDVLVERFHADARVKTGEALLSERLPSVRVTEQLSRPREGSTEPRSDAVPAFPGWTPDGGELGAALLGNGRLMSLVTDSGAGSTSWNGVAITRGGFDTTRDVDGTWIYLRDEERGRLWSATPAPTRAPLPSDEVVFHAHEVEFHHRDEGLSLHTEIAVAAMDDVEIRHVSLHNESDEDRSLTLMTYAEPVLEPEAGSVRQPAFSRLFVECEPLPAQHAIVASRRARSPSDPVVVMVQSLVWEDPAMSWVGLETDRRAFLGRRRDARSPQWVGPSMEPPAPGLSTLDPALVLAVRVKLGPRARVEVALVTAVAKTRDAALDLTRRFGSLHAARWAIHDARRELARRLGRQGVSTSLFPSAMRIVSKLVQPSGGTGAARPAFSGLLPSKSSLWGFGISGDDPLLVVRIRDRVHGSLVEDVLATYRFLRMSGKKVEIVFLDEASSGYQAQEPGSVQSLLLDAGAGPWLNQRGGVFVLATDQLSAQDRGLLQCVARLLLDSERGSLADQVTLAAAPMPLLPPIAATRSGDVESGAPREPPSLLFDNEYGGFSEDGREYVIRAAATRATPAPWCNVLANDEAGCLVSESSLGATWAGNSGENRLTPWRNDPVTDAPSEALYLRDEETAQVWSSTPLPAGLDVETCVRHGAGYTTYERESHGLGQQLTVFVPHDAPLKILRLRLTNRSARHRRLTATYYVEWVLGVLREEQQARIACAFDPDAQCLLARCGWNADFAERVAFVSADRAVHGFTFDRMEFLGRSGSYARPAALGRWGLSGSGETGGDPCAALQTHLELAAGQSLDVHFVLGQGCDQAHAARTRPAFPTRWPRSRRHGRPCMDSGTRSSAPCRSRRRSPRWTSW